MDRTCGRDIRPLADAEPREPVIYSAPQKGFLTFGTTHFPSVYISSHPQFLDISIFIPTGRKIFKNIVDV